MLLCAKVDKTAFIAAYFARFRYVCSPTFSRPIFSGYICGRLRPFSGKTLNRPFETVFRPFEGVYGEGTPLSPPQTIPQTLRKIFLFYFPNPSKNFFLEKISLLGFLFFNLPRFFLDFCGICCFFRPSSKFIGFLELFCFSNHLLIF